jgi:hypothetical protein
MNDTVALAARFNQECECVGTDLPALRRRLDTGMENAGVTRPILETHPHLFADVPVFVAGNHVREMQRVIDAVEAVTRLPLYREQVLAGAPDLARRSPPNRAVFFGFDFHITPEGPKLIEINTNAGGALLNIELQRAQQACCKPVSDSLPASPSAEVCEQQIFDMFMTEWRLARGERPLHTIAIVDDDPANQYLYPEFLLFRKLCEAHGVRTLVVDARELTVDADGLRHGAERIDLVYNRCTDFYLSDPAHAALAEAYSRGLAVLTPHPHAHALYSSKDNLVLLSDATSLRAMGASEPAIEVLTRAIPQTLRVDEPVERWWDDRKQWFFKPASGFGGRGTYRGDKITRRAFGDVISGDYVAQQVAPPSERRRRAATDCFKLDVRSYVYDGKIQLMAARLYQGQTTNFRTAGGGFAPVYLLD